MANTVYSHDEMNKNIAGVAETRSITDLSTLTAGLLNGGGTYATYAHGFLTAEADWNTGSTYMGLILTIQGISPTAGVYIDNHLDNLDTDADPLTITLLESGTYHQQVGSFVNSRPIIKRDKSISFNVNDHWYARIPLVLLKDVCKFYAKIGAVGYGDTEFTDAGNLVPAALLTDTGGSLDFVFDCDDFSDALIGMFRQKGLSHYAVFRTTAGEGTHGYVIAFCTDGNAYIVEPQGIENTLEANWIRDFQDWFTASGGVGGVVTEPSSLDYSINSIRT